MHTRYISDSKTYKILVSGDCDFGSKNTSNHNILKLKTNLKNKFQKKWQKNSKSPKGFIENIAKNVQLSKCKVSKNYTDVCFQESNLQ